MNYLSILMAGFAYFALGGLWFTPLFGKQWDKAVGFKRPEKWRPSTIYYVGPLVGSIVGAFIVGVIMKLAQIASFSDALTIGFLVGIIGATVTTVNAISPNTPHPGLYALIVGGYHLLGLVLCSAVIYLFL